ncbi:MAG: nucleotide exchange factor GrpE [Lachnospiraceae bacterium]|nr:nucleotide exchange factor GrpE [Lachnospiraceae bacterium]
MAEKKAKASKNNVDKEQEVKEAKVDVEDTEAEQAEACENAEETTEEVTEENAPEKEGVFGKLKKDKKDKKDEQIAELNDRVMRTMAEFENFRKRTDKEKADMFENGARSVIEKLLPVVDSFERGLSILSEEEKATPIAAGMDKIHKQFLKALEDMGVTPIEAVGKEFDPNFHNAVMHGDDDKFGENIVSEEFQKGYLYKEKVVRYSMVKVEN